MLEGQQRLHDRLLEYQEERRQDHEAFTVKQAAFHAEFHGRLQVIQDDLFLFRALRNMTVGVTTWLVAIVHKAVVKWLS